VTQRSRQRLEKYNVPENDGDRTEDAARLHRLRGHPAPATAIYDRSVKSRRYASLGVRHFWILDPPARTLECYRTEAGALRLVASAVADTRLAHPDLPDFILPESLWT
jgi:hypothetical protein